MKTKFHILKYTNILNLKLEELRKCAEIPYFYFSCIIEEFTLFFKYNSGFSY